MFSFDGQGRRNSLFGNNGFDLIDGGFGYQSVDTFKSVCDMNGNLKAYIVSPFAETSSQELKIINTNQSPALVNIFNNVKICKATVLRDIPGATGSLASNICEFVSVPANVQISTDQNQVLFTLKKTQFSYDLIANKLKVTGYIH